MSNIYVSEPPTSGKVILETTAGDIEIELWSKEAPKACRNFIQLCLEGYYNATIFHRVVPGWIVQGGDPTGTGEGGESVYGAPFADEFHSRLRFTRRGILAMANAGPNDNGSQFFITLAPTPELNKKHTIFGTVVGDSLFTALKLGEGEIDKETERPTAPKSIKATRVLDNPFPEIVPRARPQEVLSSGSIHTEALASIPAAKKKKIKVINSKKLLSFAADDDDDDDYDDAFAAGTPAGKIEKQATNRTFMKSSHDLLESDPTLSKNTHDLSGSTAQNHRPDGPRTSAATVDQSNPVSKAEPESPGHLHGNNSVSDQIKQAEEDIRKLSERKTGVKDKTQDKPQSDTKSGSLADMLSRYKTKNDDRSGSSRKRNKRNEDDIFARLNSFQAKIRKTKGPEQHLSKSSERSKQNCSLHGVFDCKTCQPNEPSNYRNLGNGSSRDHNDGDWLSHKLVFQNSAEKPSASEYAPKVDDYVVIDPREGK
ncbi:Peptidyl-prolyl isomerase cwc27 [Coemansia interrupta]|uniref:Peptidyl-prolyl isomerase CWC27 n=1 Tax=Coemansia interrupta TaxID=1126814 RepID=A0A9W8HKF1_9FUNG|nr:Peptidyl-prolyl isomerase cwc27 [Coemansia interrupta]